MEKININCEKAGSKLPHMWSKCIGAGRACEGLRAQWQNQLRKAVKECGFEYIRLHGLLAEDMFAYREENGTPFYNWYYIDQLYDFLMEIGIRPIVEFGFMPPDLASSEGYQFWWRGNVTPPKDYGKWADLIQALVEHWKERYGLEEIRRWYYEIWNEPNLYAFWHGTKSQYFELYKVSAWAIKSIDPQLRVGGPATSNFVPDDRFAGETEDVSKQMTHQTENLDGLKWGGVWIEDFLEFCEREGLPVDFVSTHPYPTDFALDGQQTMKGRSRYRDSLKDDIQWLRKVVRKSAYPDAEIHLTEWSSSPTSRDYSHDFLPEADYILRSNLDCAGMADSLSYWVFTDIFEEEGGGPEAFHGGFGLMNMHGIPKPSYHAYRFLHGLGTELVEHGEGYAVTKTEDGRVSAVFYHYPQDFIRTVPISEYPDHSTAEAVQSWEGMKNMTLTLSGLREGALFQMEIMNRENTSTSLWTKMGYPRNLTVDQERILKGILPEKRTLCADENGTLVLNLNMEPWMIIYLKEI